MSNTTKLCPIAGLKPCVKECKFARQRIQSDRGDKYDPERDYDCLLSLMAGDLCNMADSMASMRPPLNPPRYHEQKEKETIVHHKPHGKDSGDKIMDGIIKAFDGAVESSRKFVPKPKGSGAPL